MDSVETYIKLGERPNTERSYMAAIRHFEQVWHGLLPATPDTIARYLADSAPSFSINTLRLRLAGLSRWHTNQGFPDPTKAKIVSQVLKGIRAAHTAPEKQAKPLVIQQLQHVCDWLESSPVLPDEDPHLHQLRQTRDRAMLLIGFWRGFRADELTRIAIENIAVEPGVGMTLYMSRTKGDREYEGRQYLCPTLSRLCPVTAYEAWLALSGLKEGPVFRKIDRWGHVSPRALGAGSVIPWLRSLLQSAGVADAEQYSSHSLRRGFAGWADTSGWDLKELMEYVGWKDIASAMRYLDTSGGNLQARFEKGLAPPPAPNDQAPSIKVKHARRNPTLKLVK